MDLENIKKLAKKVWDYHHVNHNLEKADIIFVLCSHDLRIADYAAKLFLDNYSSILVFSGGIAHQGDLIGTPWKSSEAEMFANRAIELGVPKENIIIEDRAKNCGENVLFTDKILKEKEIKFDSILAVQKPYMEKRTFATIKVHWPDKKVIVTSPMIEFEDYPNSDISFDNLINIMVGDLQRIKIYPAKGFQIFQEIPNDVWEAYEELIKIGYTKHLA